MDILNRLLPWLWARPFVTWSFMWASTFSKLAMIIQPWSLRWASKIVSRRVLVDAERVVGSPAKFPLGCVHMGKSNSTWDYSQAWEFLSPNGLIFRMLLAPVRPGPPDCSMDTSHAQLRRQHKPGILPNRQFRSSHLVWDGKREQQYRHRPFLAVWPRGWRSALGTFNLLV